MNETRTLSATAGLSASAGLTLPTPIINSDGHGHSRILVSLATYNERDNLAPLIREIHAFAPTAHVLVIDDNSPDVTGQLADQLASPAEVGPPAAKGLFVSKGSV